MPSEEQRSEMGTGFKCVAKERTCVQPWKRNTRPDGLAAPTPDALLMMNDLVRPSLVTRLCVEVPTGIDDKVEFDDASGSRSTPQASPTTMIPTVSLNSWAIVLVHTEPFSFLEDERNRGSRQVSRPHCHASRLRTLLLQCSHLYCCWPV
jgi:hypothetical protein